jgi:hypothetical protein
MGLLGGGMQVQIWKNGQLAMVAGLYPCEFLSSSRSVFGSVITADNTASIFSTGFLKPELLPGVTLAQPTPRTRTKLVKE